MTIHRVYSLHDDKAVVYNPPFCVQNDALAKRMVADLVADNNTTVGRHPSDFRLYCIGIFDDQNGSMQPFDSPEHVVDAIAFAARIVPSMFDMPVPGLVRETRPNGEVK